METLTKNQIELQPWQAIPDQMAALGLTKEDGMTKVWYLEKNGRLTGGAEAINRSMRHCWWLYPITFLYFIPGIRQLQDRLYRWIANNRYRLPGSTPQCELPTQLDGSHD